MTFLSDCRNKNLTEHKLQTPDPETQTQPPPILKCWVLSAGWWAEITTGYSVQKVRSLNTLDLLQMNCCWTAILSPPLWVEEGLWKAKSQPCCSYFLIQQCWWKMKQLEQAYGVWLLIWSIFMKRWENSGTVAGPELSSCKASCAKKWEALPNCNNLIRLLTSCFAHCLPQSFSSPSLFVLLSLSFIFILSPGAVEHLVYLPYSPTLWPQRRGWPNLVSIDRELQWHGESQSMPRHPGQGSMTKW